MANSPLSKRQPCLSQDDSIGVARIEQIGAETDVETHVREDAIRLLGVPSEHEGSWFAYLQTIPGVGANVALAIIDIMTTEELIDVVALQDKAAVSRANGVGPKLAQRIVQGPSTKQGPKSFLPSGAIAARRAAAAPGAGSLRAEAMSALFNLGIDQSSAAPELIRVALNEVSR